MTETRVPLTKLDCQSYEEVNIFNLPKHVENIINNSLKLYLTFPHTSQTARAKINQAIASMEKLTRYNPEHKDYVMNIFSELASTALTLQRIKQRCSLKDDILQGITAAQYHVVRYTHAVAAYLAENEHLIEEEPNPKAN